MAQPLGEGDIVHVHNAVDAMQVAPVSSEQRRAAALTVCEVMAGSSDQPHSIRVVLEMLDVAALDDSDV